MIQNNYFLTADEIKQVTKLGFSQKWEHVLYSEVFDWYLAFMSLYAGLKCEITFKCDGEIKLIQRLDDSTKNRAFQKRSELLEFAIEDLKYFMVITNK